MALLRASAALAVVLMLQSHHAAAWGNSDTLYIYNSDTLADISASEACVNAMSSNVSCYAGLSQAVTQTTSWSANALSEMCTSGCSSALSSYVSSVDEACGTSTQYNISGISQTASDRGKEMKWRYDATCLTDSASGTYCNTLFQNAISNGTTNIKCSACYLEYLSTLVNSKWGQDILLSPSALTSQVSSCSTSGYSVTYTPTSTASSTASASATVAASRCNTTDPDQTVYKVESGDTCLSISAAQNVSTSALINLNSLDTGCTHIVAGAEICLPDVCEIYRVQETDTIDKIVASLSRQVSVPQFVAWNANLNSAQSSQNLTAVSGKYICVSPPGTLTLPDTLALRPASTAVSLPTDAVTSSNTDCGHWYQVQDGDTCESVCDKFSISQYNFNFLNPQAALNATSSCGSLWKGNSYCVQAVGNINTYTSYISNTTRTRTSLASTMNLNATRTANHSTTNLFWSFPSDLTTASTWTPDSAYLASLATYTLCDQVNSVYNITDDDLTDEMYHDEVWLSEYERVCYPPVNGSFPTTGFNFSITLTDDPSMGSSTNFDAASRAWRHFVREQWVGGDGADQQKRALIERWATADQQFRDSYQSRAPEDEPSFFEGPELTDKTFGANDVQSSCMVYFYTTELTPEKEALLAKCILGLFPWEDGWDFLADEMIVFVPPEDNKGNVLETFKFYQSVARPNFLDMHMALDGTVLFRDCSPKLIIDDRTLETGLGLWVDFTTNGIYEIARRGQIMMEEFAYFYREIGPGNRVPIDQALNYIEDREIYIDRDEDADPREILEDEPVDMRRPLVEIYKGNEVDLVDDYAPGFREAEEQGDGLAIGFDLERILANDGNPLIVRDHGSDH
ncbi:hypothetical protein LCP9604111_1193 [Penicillium roqueforti]|uniref:uncharacterized protein n=1 Tax=Penicillium roqueforti TaxID=5082 RepID=UPI0019094543|nr:uncharacterized protein LCP9604111_1193 [Penicillium roqueforti]KAF9253667.1 hypothetical protein LCP9604111_1193 [Penicillium roqueforti]KAI2686312.1 hypothetical protein CBS147355_1799 [Penicillium roqueforti]KAI2691642.1 hypothetical protein LCP963914a_1843 [Penicillium roqueforti]KAI2724778.1 hypothetical protein CBS147318_1709 [Penicillium roqueforti]KAI3142988.1 hypothetical protein CBS147330_775 [Penicillium roqueforti]